MMRPNIMEWSNKDTLEFIRAYEHHPVLWDPANPGNKSRIKLNAAWTAIQQEFGSHLEIANLKRKKESLLSTYRLLKKKVIVSKKTGQPYKPSWFAYETLDRFIGSRSKKKRSQDAAKNPSPNEEDSMVSDPMNSHTLYEDCGLHMGTNSPTLCEVLVEKLREVAPGADREMAKKKINALRTNYRREFKKMKELEAKHVVYEPKLWYFRDIDFLRDMEMTGDDNDRDDEGSRLLVGEESLLAKEHSTSISSSETPIQTPAPARDVTVKREPSEDVHVVDDAPCQPVNAYSDEAEILAKIWASEYDQLRPDQRLFAKKAINDVLFEARLGTLTRYSVTINESHLAAPSSSYYVNSSSLVESPGCSISVEEPDVKRPR